MSRDAAAVGRGKGGGEGSEGARVGTRHVAMFPAAWRPLPSRGRLPPAARDNPGVAPSRGDACEGGARPHCPAAPR
eukprot:6738025-Prymnesium_polylepis.1